MPVVFSERSNYKIIIQGYCLNSMIMSIAKRSLMFFLVLFLPVHPGFVLQAQSSLLIKGAILDRETKEKLPYASLRLKNYSIGTISNEAGEFHFYIPQSTIDDTLVIAYVGYKSIEIPVGTIRNDMVLKLQPVAIAIDELYVYPLSPQEYIKRAVARLDENYAKSSFMTIACFNEEVKENGLYISACEAIFKSYYPEYTDSVKNQHQLVLYREPEEMHEFAFMKEWREKRKRKEARKAEKKGEKSDPDNSEEDVFVSFGGPEMLLDFNIRNKKDAFLDSTNFKRFTYLFGKNRFYQGKKLMVIHFEAKRAIDNFKETGVILMDPDNYAIVSIESTGMAIVPVAIRPILLALGLGVKNPVFNRTMKYEQYKGSYYPKDFHWDISVFITKRHVFKKDEHSHIEAGQLFFVNKISTEKGNPVPAECVFDPEKKMKEQICSEENITWNEMNILKK